MLRHYFKHNFTRKIQTFSQRLKNNSDKKGIHKNVKKTWVKPQ